jgi:RNA ligase
METLGEMAIDKQLLRQMIDERYVSIQKHPHADLFIYNYTAKAQYSNTWNEVTLQCRGLILDAGLNIVARPFKKFFNLDEYPASDIPDEPFEVYEKMDGSLGILYWLNDEPFIATRGSFISAQAAHATGVLQAKYAGTFDKINRDVTYLFEIVYPENRIVVDYGTTDDLVLIAVIDNKTGADLPLPAIGFPVVKKYDGINDFTTLKSLDEVNKEGFVIKFKSGLRAKVKLAEYLRLHRIVTGVSNLVIWEHLSEGRSFDEILADSQSSFQQLDTSIHSNRKETALYFQTQKYPAVLFALLDGKPIDNIIWKMIRPQYSKPFKVEN